jgi:hypothetical protein
MFNKVIKKIIQSRKKRIFRKYVINDFSLCEDIKISNNVKKFCKKHLFSISDYYVLNLKHNNYKDYVPSLWAYYPRFKNDQTMLPISDNKFISSYVYSKYFNMPKTVGILQNNTFRGADEFYNFTIDDLFQYSKHNALILKPYDGQNGNSIFSLECKNDCFYFNRCLMSKEQIIKELKKANHLIVQEEAKQSEYSSKIFPDSINTIRIVSARKKECKEHEILCAVHRFGNHITKTCDNFNQGGFSSWIDIKSGTLGPLRSFHKEFRDKNDISISFDKHPDTGAVVTGIVIPFWNLITEKIISFSKECPVFEFLAWDIFLDKNNVVSLIETNTKSSLNVFQIHAPVLNTKFGETLRRYKNEKI